jgi:hypothetical protein
MEIKTFLKKLLAAIFTILFKSEKLKVWFSEGIKKEEN